MKKENLPYLDFSEVMTETLDLIVLDLNRYVQRMEKRILDMLEPAPIGVYMNGRLEPVLNFSSNTRYFFHRDLEALKKAPDMPSTVLSFEDFISTNEPIYNERGVMMSANQYAMRRNFSRSCSVNYSAVWLAASNIFQIFRSLQEVAPPKIRGLRKAMLYDTNWIKKECLEEFYRTSNPAMSDLLTAVHDHIGRDRFNVYTLELSNTTLRIEKGNDYRVIEYYRPIFDKLEKERFEKFGF